jgi:hypothetical protein
MKIFWLGLISLLTLMICLTSPADAGQTGTVTITAQPWSSGDCPNNFVLNAVSPYEIQMDWTNGGNMTNAVLRGAYGRWPTDATDGFSVYVGTGNSTTHWVNTEFIGVDVYYRLWGELGGNYSLCYASGTVQGGEDVSAMGVGLISIIPLGLMALSMAWFKITGKDGWAIMLGAGLAWIALAVLAFGKSEEAWDVYQIIGALSIAMLLLCALLTFSKVAQKPEVQIVVKAVPKSYGERYSDFEKSRGLKNGNDKKKEPQW